MNIWEPQPRAREGIRPQTLCGANDLEQFPRKVFREEFVIFRERGRKSPREKAVWPRRPDRQSCDGGGEERRSGGGTEAHACADRHGAKRKLRRRRRREAKKKNCDGLVKSFCIFGWTQANPLPQKTDGTTNSSSVVPQHVGKRMIHLASRIVDQTPARSRVDQPAAGPSVKTERTRLRTRARASLPRIRPGRGTVSLMVVQRDSISERRP